MTQDDEPDPVEIPIEDALDLHPFWPNETAQIVESYLEEAVLRGFREVRLIHGRGISAQRATVRATLSRSPLVTSFRDAEPGRGGWGATIATLVERVNTAGNTVDSRAVIESVQPSGPGNASGAAKRTTVIRGSGMYVPPGIVTNDMLSRIMDTTDEWIVPRTGIRERRYVDPAQGSSTLGALAAQAALENAGLTAKDIDFVIFATMTPDHYFPGNGGLLASALGMETTHALDIRMQCAGFLSGLQTADAFIRSGTYDRILLVGADVHSSLMPWPESVWDVLLGRAEGPCDPAWYAKATGMRDRAVLFGDAGGAMVLEANDSGDGRGFLGFRMYTDGAHWQKLYVPGGGSAHRPYMTGEMQDRLETVPIVEGRQVFRLATQLMPAAVREVLERAGATLDDVDLVLMHQANLRINEAVQKVLELPDAKVFNNIQKYGNTTSATLPLVYDEARRGGRIQPGSLVCFTALGAGLHWGAALARI